ncbi:rhomboid family intramembrane serine protease [Kitasatospora herbaricolor]|uniref:rhomboid family intramembrane serine protease n=1 Tax=Kitasatospora herbaricolor TaxID=68217 RepID=UPI0017481462|nr:rhomboid family intramembrane serine protease [Kitasatospora herbaricolor]MDQ0309363.1 membrane associated rhomboid family serine protease [Kitasatospora herbaricolor]GGV49615.1 rhomboid family intramembrane serine protease [Kitasatospora herbaricolor]
MASDDRSSTPALDPARMIADARRAFFVMIGVLAVVWLIQVANWADDYRLTQDFGIRPQQVGRLGDVFAAPFLHMSWKHLEGNSGPLFIFGFLAAYRGVRKFLGLTVLITVTSGAAVWLFQGTDTISAGASGVIFGYFGYVVLRGVFDRNLVDTLIGAVMGASFAYILTTALPGTPGVSWLGHLGGLAGGLAGAWIFRDRGGRKAPPALATVPGPARSAHADLLKELDDLGI